MARVSDVLSRFFPSRADVAVTGPSAAAPLEVVSDDELVDILGRESVDLRLFQSALATAAQRRSAIAVDPIIRSILRRDIESIDKNINESITARDKRRLLEIHTFFLEIETLCKIGTDDAIVWVKRIAKKDDVLSCWAALSAGRCSLDFGIPLLIDMVDSKTADPIHRMEGAILLKNEFDENHGLHKFSAGLGSDDEETFLASLSVFIGVGMGKRDQVFYDFFHYALGSQHNSHHLVTMMFLAEGPNLPRRITDDLRDFLSDRRKATQLFPDRRKGRVGDFAIYYLARRFPDLSPWAERAFSWNPVSRAKLRRAVERKG